MRPLPKMAEQASSGKVPRETLGSTPARMGLSGLLSAHSRILSPQAKLCLL